MNRLCNTAQMKLRGNGTRGFRAARPLPAGAAPAGARHGRRRAARRRRCNPGYLRASSAAGLMPGGRSRASRPSSRLRSPSSAVMRRLANFSCDAACACAFVRAPAGGWPPAAVASRPPGIGASTPSGQYRCAAVQPGRHARVARHQPMPAGLGTSREATKHAIRDVSCPRPWPPCGSARQPSPACRMSVLARWVILGVNIVDVERAHTADLDHGRRL